MQYTTNKASNVNNRRAQRRSVHGMTNNMPPTAKAISEAATLIGTRGQ
jgi:hypothetical protein